MLLLLAPAVTILQMKGRYWVKSDLFAVALAVWMLISSALSGGFTPYVGAEALEFLGAYLVGRAFIFGNLNLGTFLRALRIMTAIIIALALFDTMSGQHLTLTTLGLQSSSQLAAQDHRFGLVRAESIFETPEHYGAFCVSALSIFLYAEYGVRRAIYVVLTIFGCALSLESGPFMGVGVAAGIVCYDRLLQRIWKWRALLFLVGAVVAAVFLLISNPAAWIIVHLTIDPQTGFFRLGTWNAAIPLIEESPLVGHGLASLVGSDEGQQYLTTVDCLWLVEALRYGLPSIVLLVLTMFSPFIGGQRLSKLDPPLYRIQKGVSLSIVSMSLIGLTVHYWDAPWLFFSLCIGIRAGMAELLVGQVKAATPREPVALVPRS